MGLLIRRRVTIDGDVQGVFFRDSIREQAQREHVSGWVRNRSDGTVEAVFEGEPAAVARLIEFAHSGPPRAQVTDVEVTEESPEGLSSFNVR
jgi:acylphosphatase